MKLDTYNKCHFCINYRPIVKNEECVYSMDANCQNYSNFKANKKLIVTKAREWDLSVGDVVILMNLE